MRQRYRLRIMESAEFMLAHMNDARARPMWEGDGYEVKLPTELVVRYQRAQREFHDAHRQVHAAVREQIETQDAARRR